MTAIPLSHDKRELRTAALDLTGHLLYLPIIMAHLP